MKVGLEMDMNKAIIGRIKSSKANADENKDFMENAGVLDSVQNVLARLKNTLS